MRRLVACLTMFLLVGCLDVASERALVDEGLGRGQTGDASCEVEHGLAVLRAFEPGLLQLWAKAPAIRVRMRRGPSSPERWIVRVKNSMPDALLRAETDAGETLAMEQMPSERPTERAWSLALPSEADVTLSIEPASGEPRDSWRFALLSDVQEAIDRVGDIYARMNRDAGLRFVVSAGDLTRFGSQDELERFERELLVLDIPFFPTLGNHELGTDGGAPFQRHFGRASFRFSYGGMQFSFLDSASATLEPRVYEWLETWLEEGRSKAHAVLMHIPPIDPIGVRNGSFASRDEAAKLLSLLAGGGVDLTLYGHIHSYYAFANAGIPAYISGGGGALPERFDGIGRHYLTVDVDPGHGVLRTSVVRVDPE